MRGQEEEEEEEMPPPAWSDLRWCAPGSGVEVVVDEEGLKGSRYGARIIRIVDASARVPTAKALVVYDHFTSEEDEEVALEEWVACASLRPAPPPSPPDFFEQIAVGDALEVWHADGWWEVTLWRAPTEEEPAYLVRSDAYSRDHTVDAAHLRPHWQFCENHWQASAPAG